MPVDTPRLLTPVAGREASPLQAGGGNGGACGGKLFTDVAGAPVASGGGSGSGSEELTPTLPDAGGVSAQPRVWRTDEEEFHPCGSVLALKGAGAGPVLIVGEVGALAGKFEWDGAAGPVPAVAVATGFEAVSGHCGFVLDGQLSCPVEDVTGVVGRPGVSDAALVGVDVVAFGTLLHACGAGPVAAGVDEEVAAEEVAGVDASVPALVCLPQLSQ